MSEVTAVPKAELVPVTEKDIPKKGMLRIFKCRRAHVQYIFRDGSIAVFVPRTSESAGHYLTSDPAKIAELEEVIKGHPHLYKDPNEFEVEAELADPAVAARAKIAEETRKEFMQQITNPELLKSAGIDPAVIAKLLQGARDFGGTDAKPDLQGIANSDNVNAAMADSNGVVQGVAKVPAAAPVSFKQV